MKSIFWWDYSKQGHRKRDGYAGGYRAGNYLPLETIDDLLDQFNYVGFTDICIYPELWWDLVSYNDASSTDTKGIVAVYNGHTYQNQTGK